MLASSLREETQATVSNKPGNRGEREVSRKTIARGMPGRSGVTVVTMLVCLFYFACEAAGASSARHSLRPPISGRKAQTQLGRIAPRGRGRMLVCHCEERSDANRHCEPTGRANARPMTGYAKQSIARATVTMDCFVASLLAMTVVSAVRKAKRYCTHYCASSLRKQGSTVLHVK